MKKSLQTGAHASPLSFSPLGGGGGTADLVSAFSALREEVLALREELKSQREEIALLRALVAPVRNEKEELPVPASAWEALLRSGIVDEEHAPLVSRTEAAVLAHVLGGAYGIEGWAPFERAWKIANLRVAWQRALGAQKTSKLLTAYAEIIGC